MRTDVTQYLCARLAASDEKIKIFNYTVDWVRDTLNSEHASRVNRCFLSIRRENIINNRSNILSH